jgi:glycosyltransferase involved in cell wall biosynthesis
MRKRILHVVGGMNRGGAETWLMHIMRHIDRQSFRMDFLVHTNQPGAFDEEIRALGGKIFSCLHPSRPWAYAFNFKRILRQHGPYSIVHSHVHLYSGFILRLAKQTGVPDRIAHSHNDTLVLHASAGSFRRFYQVLMESWISRYATLGLACSKLAAAALFGRSWEEDSRWQVIHYGIDLSPFKTQIDSKEIRSELGIPSDAFVVGHVGRFSEQKNHTFLIKIAQEIARREKKFCLLLIGDGGLRPAIEKQVAQAGLTEAVRFTGVRADVPRLMQGAMDVFLFPSFFEGLGLVLIEAQAAGLPCIFSDVIPREADVVEPLLKRLSLTQSVSSWAEAVLATRDQKLAITRPEALAAVEQSSFNILKSVSKLANTYIDLDKVFHSDVSRTKLNQDG